MRRTKIICTIGPASESREKIQQLLTAGMNVARLNFSHGTYEEHGWRMSALKEEAARAGKHLGILLDTKGPEIRTGMVPELGDYAHQGCTVYFGSESALGSSERVGITYKELWLDVVPGTHILIDDGQLDLEFVSVQQEVIKTIVRNGGILKSQKGVNVPGVAIKLPGVTKKDIEDIRFSVTQGIDFIAASFTRKSSDILAVRQIVEEMGATVISLLKLKAKRES